MCSIAHEGYDKVSDQPIWGGRNFLRAATIRLFCYIQQPSVITEGQRGSLLEIDAWKGTCNRFTFNDVSPSR